MTFSTKAGIFLFALFSAIGLPRPLEESDIKKAKSVVFLSGTFDPITNGHIHAAERAREKSGADIVILLPRVDVKHKNAQSYATRQSLVHAALKEDPHLLYPYGNALGEEYEAHKGYTDPSFVNHLKKLNPQIKTFVLGGSEVLKRPTSRFLLERKFSPDGWIAHERPDKGDARGLPSNVIFLEHSEGEKPVSSTGVRRLLIDHPEWYAQGKTHLPSHPLDAGVPVPIRKQILEDGLYLDAVVDTHVSYFQNAKNKFSGSLKSILYDWGIWERIKSKLISQIETRSVPKSFDLNGRHYEVVKKLGAGLNGDVYLGEIDSHQYAIKIPRNTHGVESTRKSIPIHLWIEASKTMGVPQILDYDPKGNWVVNEFVEGKTLKQELEKGPLSNEMRKKTIELLEEVVVFQKKHGVKLDIAPDNIMVTHDRPYLVDMGPLPKWARLPRDAKATLKRWENLYLPAQTAGEGTCRQAFKWIASRSR